MIVVEYCWWK